MGARIELMFGKISIETDGLDLFEHSKTQKVLILQQNALIKDNSEIRCFIRSYKVTSLKVELDQSC